MGRLTRGSASQGAMPAETDNTVEEGLEGTRVETRRPILRLMVGLGLRAYTAPRSQCFESPGKGDAQGLSTVHHCFQCLGQSRHSIKMC